MVIRSQQFRIYPNKEQQDSLNMLLTEHRFLYNCALKQRIAAKKISHKTLSCYDQQKQANNSDLLEFLPHTNAASRQLTLRRLDRTFNNFFRGRKAGRDVGHPRFKSKNRFRSFEYTYGNGIEIQEGKLRLQNVGWLILRPRPNLESVKCIRILLKANKWYAQAVYRIEILTAKNSNPSIGIDLGLLSFISTSNGEQVKPPKFYRKVQKYLRRKQRALARCKKGSNRRRKVKLQISRLHEKTANQRKDWNHKLSRNIVNRYGLICIEDLNVAAMGKNSKLAKSIYDAGWRQFTFQLEYKAESAGSRVVRVNPKNTSQMCSHCYKLPTIKLGSDTRIYHCKWCNYIEDRDINAAKNILRLGTSQQAITKENTLCVACIA